MDAATVPASPAGSHPRFGRPGPLAGPRCDTCGEPVRVAWLPELGRPTWRHASGWFTCDRTDGTCATVFGSHYVDRAVLDGGTGGRLLGLLLELARDERLDVVARCRVLSGAVALRHSLRASA